jgi:hypothetical protein
MKANYSRAFRALEKIGVPVIEDGEYFRIDAEAENSFQFCDYYNEFGQWDFGVSPEVSETLAKYGLHAEWINPGELGVYE